MLFFKVFKACANKNRSVGSEYAYQWINPENCVMRIFLQAGLTQNQNISF